MTKFWSPKTSQIVHWRNEIEIDICNCVSYFGNIETTKHPNDQDREGFSYDLVKGLTVNWEVDKPVNCENEQQQTVNNADTLSVHCKNYILIKNVLLQKIILNWRLLVCCPTREDKHNYSKVNSESTAQFIKCTLSIEFLVLLIKNVSLWHWRAVWCNEIITTNQRTVSRDFDQ